MAAWLPPSRLPLKTFNRSRKVLLVRIGACLTAHTDPKRPKGFWQNQENRRKFFCEFADQVGFDPYVPTNWATIGNKDILAKEVVTSCLKAKVKDACAHFIVYLY